MSETTGELSDLVTSARTDESATGTTRPVVAGFYPDPSACRVGSTYYLVNSSFEYLPALPVHSSTDLVSWTTIGNAMTRPSQIAEHDGMASTGTYAPTIRHHDGTFWIIGTNVLDLPAGRGHFLMHADDPAGPWSDPVHVAGAMGIDPDIVWDEAGTCHVTWASLDPQLPGIVSVPIDPATGAMLDTPRQLWQGTGLAAPEGPHLYRIDDWWYLLLAEGGTERGHAATIARARTLDGPFEPAPHNPFLSHRSTPSAVQNVGHADLIERADGTWAAVHLGVRPGGQTPGFHVNGRETFLVGIDWIDGWPVVDEQRFAVSAADHSFVDTFEADELDPRWLGVGRFPRTFTDDAIDGGLAIEALGDGDAPTLLATRVRDDAWTAEAQLCVLRGSGRFVLRLDDKHQYGLAFDGESVEAFLTIGPVTQTLERIPVPEGSEPTLRITSRPAPTRPYGGSDEPDLIELAVVGADGSEHVVGAYDGRYLSTEVAGGFTGRVLGIEALSGTITVRAVRYTTTCTPGT